MDRWSRCGLLFTEEDGRYDSKTVGHNSQIKLAELVNWFDNEDLLDYALFPFGDQTTVAIYSVDMRNLLNFEMRGMLYKLWDTQIQYVRHQDLWPSFVKTEV
jgi:hypothetical protein